VCEPMWATVEGGSDIIRTERSLLWDRRRPYTNYKRVKQKRVLTTSGYAKRPKRQICNSQILRFGRFAYIYTRYNPIGVFRYSYYDYMTISKEEDIFCPFEQLAEWASSAFH